MKIKGKGFLIAIDKVRGEIEITFILKGNMPHHFAKLTQWINSMPELDICLDDKKVKSKREKRKRGEI